MGRIRAIVREELPSILEKVIERSINKADETALEKKIPELFKKAVNEMLCNHQRVEKLVDETSNPSHQSLDDHDIEKLVDKDSTLGATVSGDIDNDDPHMSTPANASKDVPVEGACGSVEIEICRDRKKSRFLRSPYVDLRKEHEMKMTLKEKYDSFLAEKKSE